MRLRVIGLLALVLPAWGCSAYTTSPCETTPRQPPGRGLSPGAVCVISAGAAAGVLVTLGLVAGLASTVASKKPPVPVDPALVERANRAALAPPSYPP